MQVPQLNNMSNPSARAAHGATLIELMVALGIGSIVLAGLASLTSYSARTFLALTNYADLDQNSQSALDRMTKEIRQADGVLSYSTNQIILTNKLNSRLVSFTYNPIAQTLVATNGTVETYLTKCESFAFAFFTDNTITNTFDQYAATGTNDLKMIQVSWRCYRTVIGQRNTESIQSAKIMIRKQ
jgi:prepilin-type N-terminal cleavage/methylation domain-containing protein